MYLLINCATFAWLTLSVVEFSYSKLISRSTLSDLKGFQSHNRARRQANDEPQATPSQEYFSNSFLPYSQSSFQYSRTRGTGTSNENRESSRSTYSFPERIRYSALTDPASTQSPTRIPTTARMSRYRGSSYRSPSSRTSGNFMRTSSSSSSYRNYGRPNSQTRNQIHAGRENARGSLGQSQSVGGQYPFGQSSSRNSRYPSPASYQSSQNYYSNSYSQDYAQVGGAAVNPNRYPQTVYSGSDIRIGSSSTRYDPTALSSSSDTTSNRLYTNRINSGYPSSYGSQGNYYNGANTLPFSGNSYGGYYDSTGGRQNYGSPANHYSGNSYSSSRTSLPYSQSSTSSSANRYAASNNFRNQYFSGRPYSAQSSYTNSPAAAMTYFGSSRGSSSGSFSMGARPQAERESMREPYGSSRSSETVFPNLGIGRHSNYPSSSSFSVHSYGNSGFRSGSSAAADNSYNLPYSTDSANQNSGLSYSNSRLPFPDSSSTRGNSGSLYSNSGFNNGNSGLGYDNSDSAYTGSSSNSSPYLSKGVTSYRNSGSANANFGAPQGSLQHRSMPNKNANMGSTYRNYNSAYSNSGLTYSTSGVSRGSSSEASSRMSNSRPNENPGIRLGYERVSLSNNNGLNGSPYGTVRSESSTENTGLPQYRRFGSTSHSSSNPSQTARLYGSQNMESLPSSNHVNSVSQSTYDPTGASLFSHHSMSENSQASNGNNRRLFRNDDGASQISAVRNEGSSPETSINRSNSVYSSSNSVYVASRSRFPYTNRQTNQSVSRETSSNRYYLSNPTQVTSGISNSQYSYVSETINSPSRNLSPTTLNNGRLGSNNRHQTSFGANTRYSGDNASSNYQFTASRSETNSSSSGSTNSRLITENNLNDPTRFSHFSQFGTRRITSVRGQAISRDGSIIVSPELPNNNISTIPLSQSSHWNNFSNRRMHSSSTAQNSSHFALNQQIYSQEPRSQRTAQRTTYASSENSRQLPSRSRHRLNPNSRNLLSRMLSSNSERLPDIYVDERKLITNFNLDRKPLSSLTCARGAGCLSKSASLPSNDMSMQRKLLRFQTTVHNIGSAPFLPHLEKSQWLWHACHNHSHSMAVFTHYDLLDLRSRKKVAEGHKASFCLEDSSCRGRTRKIYDCDKGHQGISPGCEDTYKASIDCQWIDVTDVPQGEYIFRITVNPTRLVRESNFHNNGLECQVQIKRYAAKIWNCQNVGV